MRYNLAVTLGVALLMSTQAQAQGTTETFGVTSTLRLDDNFTLSDPSAGDSSQLTNALTYSLESETRAASIRLDLGAEAVISDIAGGVSEAQIGNPFAGITFMRSGSGQTLELDADWSRTDRDLGRNDDTGERIDTGVGASFSFGEGAPFGGAFSAEADQTTYDAAAGDDDEETTRFSGSLRFEVSPRVTLSPNFSVTRNTVDDVASTETETTDIGIGATVVLSDVAVVTANIADTTIDSSDSGETSDLTWDAKLHLETPTGSQSFEIARNLSSDGSRTELTYAREFDGARFMGGFSLGLVSASDDSEAYTAGFDYEQPLANGQFSASVNRRFETDISGTESLITTASATVIQDLGETYSLALDVDYSAEDETGGTESSDTTVGLSLNRSLPADWTLTAGLEVRLSNETGMDTIQSNSVFVTLGKQWVSSR